MTAQVKLNVFIGYDEREDDAYKACEASIIQNSSQGVNHELVIHKLIKEDLVNSGCYYRDEVYPNEVVSTDFAFTRFLVPYLSYFEGYSLFCDCDFIFTQDVFEILFEIDIDDDVYCVKHDYVPRNSTKMDGKKQLSFPRKNWSSLMLFDNERCINLSPKVVSEQSPSYLHQFQWASKIGEIDREWNFLVGEYDRLPNHQVPAGIHYTNGGLWFDHLADSKYIEYGNHWLKYCDYKDDEKIRLQMRQNALYLRECANESRV